MIAGVVFGSFWVLYLPVFGLGVMLAARRRQVEEFCLKLNSNQWTLIGILGILLLLNRWLLVMLPGATGLMSFNISICALGAAMIVVIAWHCESVSKCLNTRIVQWLGSRSYSIYLIHFPVLLASAVVLGGWSIATVLLTIFFIICAAEVFHRFIEVPSIALSRRVGRRVESHLQVKRTEVNFD